MVMTSAPMIAALNPVTENPCMICATNQKNAPLITREKSPRVRMLIGSVKIVITGFTTMLRNARHAATIIAVKMLLTAIPCTKYGSANIASVVINQRSKIIAFSIPYANKDSTTFLTTAPSAWDPTSFMTAPTSTPSFALSVCPSSVCFTTAIARIFSSENCSGRNCSSI